MNETYSSPESNNADSETPTNPWLKDSDPEALANSWSRMAESLPGDVLNDETKAAPDSEAPKLGVVEDLPSDVLDHPDKYTNWPDTADSPDEDLEAAFASKFTPRSSAEEDLLSEDLLTDFDQDRTKFGYAEDERAEDLLANFDPDPTLMGKPMDLLEDLPSDVLDPAPAKTPSESPLDFMEDLPDDVLGPSRSQTPSFENSPRIPETLDTKSDQAIVGYILEQINNDHELYDDNDTEQHHELDQITEIFDQVFARLNVEENKLSVSEMLENLHGQYILQAGLATSATLERENLQKAELALEWRQNYDEIKKAQAESQRNQNRKDDLEEFNLIA